MLTEIGVVLGRTPRCTDEDCSSCVHMKPSGAYFLLIDMAWQISREAWRIPIVSIHRGKAKAE